MVDPETPAQKYELAEKQAIGVLFGLARRAEQALRQAQLRPGPVDLTPVVVEVVAGIARSMAFLLDDSLAMTGAERTIQIQPVKRDNGNGQDGPPRLVRP